MSSIKIIVFFFDKMRIWTIVAVFFLRCYCSIFGGAKVQTTLFSDDIDIKQDDSNKKQWSQSTFRHMFDDDNRSILQQSFVLIAKDEIRRLGTTQVIFICFCFRIVASLYIA